MSAVPALRVLPPALTVIPGGRHPSLITVAESELDELRMELRTSQDDRLRFCDAVRDLVRQAMRGPAAVYLDKLDRRNEREALRVRSMDLGRCPDRREPTPGHGGAA